MTYEPLVSAVIPTFNRKAMVSRAIESVLGQSYANFELFVIDDGSSDGTEESIRKYRDDDRFHYFYQENKGQSAARNFGIGKSKGEFIALLDSDNYWLKDKLKKQIEFLDGRKDIDILYSEIVPIDERGEILPKRSCQRFSGNILGNLLRANFVTNNTVLVKRKCFDEMGGFDEQLRYAEDYDLWLRLATRYRFIYHPCEVACYCCEGDRLSSQEEKVLEANQNILSRFFTMFPASVTDREKRHAWSRYYKWRIESRWGAGVKPSLNETIRAAFLNPLDIQCWRLVAKRIIR
jgi:glycosyltransferase involved in cell wall biosynthesis